MKTKTLVSVIICLSVAISALGQIPRGFNYQAIARDASGNPVSTAIQVKIGFQTDTLSSSFLWEELHASVNPNKQGLFSLAIGTGSRLSGALSFADIDWKTTPVYLKTYISTGGSFKYMGAAKLWSVPYSLLAGDLGGAVKKLEVKGEDITSDEALFEVKRKDGETMFAVYNHGVRVYMPLDTLSKARKGGFAIGGFDRAKGTVQDYFVVNPDSIRAYIDSNPGKARKGGFAIGSFDRAKDDIQKYFTVSSDSVRIYIDDNLAKARKGGFAIGSFDRAKNDIQEYLTVSSDSVRIYIDDNLAKARKGGFAIGSFDRAKAGNANFFNVAPDSTGKIYPAQNRIQWYPLKNAFLTGRIIAESKDSVGENSFASGYESKAMGSYSQALGYRAIARGNYATAIGQNALAHNANSYAFGRNAIATGIESFAFGSGSAATGLRSFSFGSVGLDSLGNPVENRPTSAAGSYSIAMGLGAKALKKGGMSFGVSSEASEDYSLAIGYESKAVGRRSLALGSRANYTESVTYPAPFNYIHMNPNSAKGDFSMALGSGNTSEAGGMAIGLSNYAVKWGSLAIGYSNKANAERSVAAGYRSETTGKYAAAIGYYTSAQSFSSFVVGSLNALGGNPDSWVDTDPLFVVGNGVNMGSATVRSNAFLVLKNGNTTAYGNLASTKRISASQGFYSDSMMLGSSHGSMVNTYPYIRMKEYKNFPMPAYSKEYRMMVSGKNFYIRDEAAYQFTISNGLVGINVTNPGHTIDIGGRARIRSGSSGSAGLWLMNAANSSDRSFFGMYDDNYAGIYGVTSGWGLLMNLNNGYVGIGTTVPSLKLHVVDNTNSAGVAAFVNSRNVYNAHGIDIMAGTAVISKLYGAAFIDFMIPGGSVIGSVTQSSTGAVAFNTTSDRRIKENIIPTRYSVKDLMRIKVIDFNYINDPDYYVFTGLVAQELNNVIPSVVTKPLDPEKNWSIDYGKLTPVIIKAVQDQQSVIEDQNEEIRLLRQEIRVLREELEKIKLVHLKE